MEADSHVGVGGRGVAREPRRRKTVWQAWQKKALLSAFTKSSYPSFEDRQDLARQTGLPESRIRVWFQNRRNRTGEVGHAPKRASRDSSQLASPQLQEEHDSRAQGRGMPSHRTRPRTRLTLLQRTLLVQAFERNPLPGFATREELAQRTGLPEDTIYIWFQNRRARHHSRGRSTAQDPDQDLLASQESDGAPGGPGGGEHEGARDSLLPVSAAGSVGLDPWSPGDLRIICREAQASQEAQPSGAGLEEDFRPSRSPGPLENLLDQLLDEVQMEEHAPETQDPEGGPGAKEYAGTQDGLLPLDEAGDVGMGPSSPSDLPTFSRESQPSQVAQPSGAGQAQAPTQASNPGPLELFLGQLMTEVQVEERVSAPLYMEDEGEQMDTTVELLLTQEDYQALLDML